MESCTKNPYSGQQDELRISAVWPGYPVIWKTKNVCVSKDFK